MNESAIASFQTETVDAAVLKKFAALHDIADGAVGIYFSRRLGATGNSQRLEIEQFLKKVHEAASKFPWHSSSSFVSFRQAIQNHPAAFHYFLSVGTETLSGTLPVSLDISQIQTGYRLDLFPLLSALELCKPFLVLLLESDKARLFVGQGDALKELRDVLPNSDLKVHADDSRVGWSHHIQGNMDHRSDAYWRELERQTTGWLNRLHIEDLVIGCRKELWGYASREFASLDKKYTVAFSPLQSFEASEHDVMSTIKQTVKQIRVARSTALETEQSDRRSVTDLASVLEALESGEASALIMTHDLRDGFMECDGCGRAQPANGENCVYCGGTGLHKALPEALLATRALLTDARVWALQDTTQPARAYLRY